MAQYIDKDALVAEIERRKIPFKKDVEDGNYPTYLCALMDFEDFLNTLEVKEVDLEKEYKDFVEEDPVYNKLVNGIVGKAIAKHFFELGMSVNNKAQKREKV